MSNLQFFIRHHDNFLREKMILIFKSDSARDYFKNALSECRFEEVTSEMAQHAARIGINGKIIPYGYTSELSDVEMNQLSTMDWDTTALILATGNERLFERLSKKNK